MSCGFSSHYYQDFLSMRILFGNGCIIAYHELELEKHIKLSKKFDE